MEETKQAIVDKIQQLVAGDPLNRHPSTGSRMFDEAVVGFADGRDPLFTEYKSIIGDFHFTPVEVLQSCGIAHAEQISVVCWILPIAGEAKASNRTQSSYPSLLWSHVRHHGEAFNDHVRKEILGVVEALGGVGAAPVFMDGFRVEHSDDGRIIGSTWSERHVMYAAGLGTFSLSDGFITPRGIAMRCGSVVTTLKLRPSRRLAADFRYNCLFYRGTNDKQVCGRCIDRCPAGAITEEGHDKDLCRLYIRDRVEPEVKDRYRVEITGCGLCQTGVPCESGIP